jgi:hypothetical protein
MNTAKTTRITLRYDGEAFKAHSMDAIQIADAIKGIATSLIQADKLLNGEQSDLKVHVVAFQDGCFGTVLDILQSDVSHIDVLKTMGFLVGSLASKDLVKGVLGYIKSMKGRPVASCIPSGNNLSTLTFADGSTIEMDADVAKLVTDKTIRKGLDLAFHQPLIQDGADSVSVGRTVEGENAASIDAEVVISEEDHITFKAPSQIIKSEKAVTELTMDVHFSKINFLGRNGWAVIFPSNEEQTVKMDDDSFFDRVNQNRQQFSSEMLFSVKFEVTTTLTQEKKMKKYAVKKVIRHRTSHDKKIIPDAK